MSHPLKEIEKEELKKLGDRVKSIRISKNLTLEEVAKRIGKDRQSIHSLEKGQFNPSYIYLLAVSKGLGIDVSELLKDIDTEPL
jgi:putative transcriptional regulator